MKIFELLRILHGCDPELEIEIDQFFDTHTSMPVRSVQLCANKVIIMDHYIMMKEQTFEAFDGQVFALPDAINERKLT